MKISEHWQSELIGTILQSRPQTNLPPAEFSRTLLIP
jgi:hypothetical protein